MWRFKVHCRDAASAWGNGGRIAGREGTACKDAGEPAEGGQQQAVGAGVTPSGKIGGLAERLSALKDHLIDTAAQAVTAFKEKAGRK